MHQEIISRKLLFISVGISIFILALLSLIHILQSKPVLVLCNTENKINMLIQFDKQDILVNPTGTKETLDCIGKHLPFYDRTIEVVITNNQEIVSVLKQRYKVNRIVDKPSVRVNNALITINQYISLEMNQQKFLVYQKQINNIDFDQLTKEIEVLSVQNDNKVINDIIISRTKRYVELRKGDVRKIF